MGQADFGGAKRYILDKMAKGLAHDLYYHDIRHTRDDVLRAVQKLGKMEGLDGEALLLLRTAAAYHDAGYLEQYWQNEEIGVRMAREALPQFGYTPGQIEVIGEIIMATRMPQTPLNLLQQIICDADLDSLGREDFFLVSHSLRLELTAYGHPTSVREWYERQQAFLEGHRYFTVAAHRLRDEGKRQNLEEIYLLLDLNEQHA